MSETMAPNVPTGEPLTVEEREQLAKQGHPGPEALPGVRHPGGVWGAPVGPGQAPGDALARLIRAGIDPCVPDTNTASDWHRGPPIGTTRARTQGEVPLTDVTASDRYVCPEGNELRPRQQRQKRGQGVTIYRAKRDCRGCPRAGVCLQQATAGRRTLSVGREAALLEAARQRLAAVAPQEQYHHRSFTPPEPRVYTE